MNPSPSPAKTQLGLRCTRCNQFKLDVFSRTVAGSPVVLCFWCWLIMLEDYIPEDTDA